MENKTELAKYRISLKRQIRKAGFHVSSTETTANLEKLVNLLNNRRFS